jgi:chemotaxis protein MotB
VRSLRFAREIQDEDDKRAWLVSFADLMTLLLVFFVLLFSISSVNTVVFREIMNSVQRSLGSDNPAALLNTMRGPYVNTERSETDEILIEGDKQSKYPKGTLESDNVESEIRYQIPGEVLFKSASASLEEKAFPALDEIVAVAARNPHYQIDIKGHTDDIPISTETFPSNWELSSVRATSVLRYFIERGISPDRLTATGYANTQPLVPNTTEENRSKNRRVEFVFKRKPL